MKGLAVANADCTEAATEWVAELCGDLDRDDVERPNTNSPVMHR
jgi:hypothetical protein